MKTWYKAVCDEHKEICDAEICGFDSDGDERCVYYIKEKGHEGNHESKDGIDWEGNGFI